MSDGSAGRLAGGAPLDAVALALDFDAHTEEPLELSDVASAVGQGRHVWLDLAYEDADAARTVLASMGLLLDEVLGDALAGVPATQAARYPGFLHLSLLGCQLRGLSLELQRVDVFLGQGFFVTLHRGRPDFVQAVRRHYRDDFRRFARSLSFLLYEVWDQLLESYAAVQKQLEARVGELQTKLRGDVDDSLFVQISELGSELLNFRKVLLPARAVLTDISTRKSAFVSEATQPFLGNMVGTVERLLQDLLVERELLSEAVELHMSLVTYRTNRVMNRLTVVSVIFLPLSFLCGVYGMNFRVLPELEWTHGYAYFWGLVVLIVGSLLYLLRRARVL